VRRGLLLSVASLLLAGCAPAGAVSSPSAATSTATSSAPALRVVAVGDSITEADSASFDDGLIGSGSWAHWAAGDGVAVLGGWAHAGATTADMLAAARPLDADVVVVMGGSNDIDADVPDDQVLTQLTAVVAAVGVPRVLLSAVPPEDGHEADVAVLNARLAELAQRSGWQFVDPMSGVRGSDGGWLPGDTDDGVHPTAAAARVIGAAIRTSLLSG
jgi:lysophospholipase L1-like esterase